MTRYPKIGPDAEFHARVFRVWWDDLDGSPIFVSEEFVSKILTKIRQLEAVDRTCVKTSQYERLLKSSLHVAVQSE